MPLLPLLAVFIVIPVTALAQAPGQPPPLPMAVDIKKVPVGAWAEYDMTVGQLPPMKSRMALVGKSADTNTLEMTMQGGMLSMAGGKMIVQTVVDADQGKDKPVKRVVMQIGDNDPMEMPVDSKQQTQFHKPDPKSFVKEETVKVAAGSFKAKHYREKTPSGDPFDFWVSPDVPPVRHRQGRGRAEARRRSGAGPGALRADRARQGREDGGHQAGQAVRPGADGRPADGRRARARGPGAARHAHAPKPAPGRRAGQVKAATSAANGGDGRSAAEQPTYDPTPRRLAEARRRGDVAQSRDLRAALALAATGAVLIASAPSIAGLLRVYVATALAQAARGDGVRAAAALALESGLRSACASWRCRSRSRS